MKQLQEELKAEQEEDVAAPQLVQEVKAFKRLMRQERRRRARLCFYGRT